MQTAFSDSGVDPTMRVRRNALHRDCCQLANPPTGHVASRGCTCSYLIALLLMKRAADERSGKYGDRVLHMFHEC
jgi:hypothetical protein